MGTINHPLSATPNLFEQLVIAKCHFYSARLLRILVLLIKRTEATSELTHATKCAWRIGKDRRAASCAHAQNFFSLGTQSRSSLFCTDRNFRLGYVWSTEMKWRTSSSTSPGTATVWVISSRKNCL